MPLDRRHFLVAGGACLASCGARLDVPGPARADGLDRLLEGRIGLLPERPGAGADHDPMAAEALDALGYTERAEPMLARWRERARGYAGEPPRMGGLSGAGSDAEEARTAALGDYGRFGDWLDFFRGEIDGAGTRAVLAEWAPRLAPGMAGATFHGLIRTAHAARAIRRRDSAARRGELAAGLAYWAARFTPLPAVEGWQVAAGSLRQTLTTLEHAWRADDADVDFSAVVDRLVQRPLAPEIRATPSGVSPRDALDEIVREAAVALLEMLVQQRQRLWLMHAVTAPAAVGILLDHVAPSDAQGLVDCARQGVVALHAAYGAPFEPLAHVRAQVEPWSSLVDRAANSGFVHTIKLIEALQRFDRGDPDERTMRSVAAQWLEWT